MRAARSYVYNRDLKPKVEARLATAVTRLGGYLMRNATESARLGRYSVELVDGELVVSELPPEGWKQLEIEGLNGDKRIGGGLGGHSIRNP